MISMLWSVRIDLSMAVSPRSQSRSRWGVPHVGSLAYDSSSASLNALVAAVYLLASFSRASIVPASSWASSPAATIGLPAAIVLGDRLGGLLVGVVPCLQVLNAVAAECFELGGDDEGSHSTCGCLHVRERQRCVETYAAAVVERDDPFQLNGLGVATELIRQRA